MTLTSTLSRLWRRQTTSAPRPLWAVATATTVDGATAHVQLEFTLDPPADDTGPETLDRSAMAAVENVLRHQVGRHPVAALPVAGDAVDWVAADLVTGATIGDVFVTRSDVEVTHELRRLVAHTAGP
jgi:hypothetical protein